MWEVSAQSPGPPQDSERGNEGTTVACRIIRQSGRGRARRALVSSRKAGNAPNVRTAHARRTDRPQTRWETHRIDAVEVAVVGQLVQPPGVHPAGDQATKETRMYFTQQRQPLALAN